MTAECVVYETVDDERTAREICERLWDIRRKAVVMRVYDMHLQRMPEAPRTTNRFAVLTEKR